MFSHNKRLKDHITRGMDHTHFMGKELTSKGQKAAKKVLGPKAKMSKGANKLGFGGMALSYAIGVPNKLERGMSLPGALALDTAESMVFMAAPEALAYYAAYNVAKSYPEMKRAAQQQRSYTKNYRFLGGDYIDTQANHRSRARAMEHIKRSRQNIQANAGNEARRYHR